MTTTPSLPESHPVDPGRRPTGFTQEHLDWVPWLDPIPLDELTGEQRAALTRDRLPLPYFRLLVRVPQALAERTAADNAIFYGRGGLPRAERELAATVTSRLNGCVYCASVHAHRASQLSKRTDDVQRLLDEGVSVRLDERWNAIIDFAAALSANPPRATADHVTRLREAGLSDAEISDVVHASAFFSWANRLMLTLGEPEVPADDSGA